MSIDRRGFLALLGASTTGLWLAPARLLAAPRELVLRMGGQCSFCGKDAAQARTMAGVQGRPARVCGDCIELCLNMLREQAGVSPPAAPPSARMWTEIEERLAAVAKHLELDEDALRRELETGLQQQTTWEARPMMCSFCDQHQDEVAKLIAGPKHHICDGCLAGAASLLDSCRGHSGG